MCREITLGLGVMGAYLCRFVLGVASTRGAGHGLE